jgi:hypothetical protein
MEACSSSASLPRAAGREGDSGENAVAEEQLIYATLRCVFGVWILKYRPVLFASLGLSCGLEFLAAQYLTGPQVHQGFLKLTGPRWNHTPWNAETNGLECKKNCWDGPTLHLGTPAPGYRPTFFVHTWLITPFPPFLAKRKKLLSFFPLHFRCHGKKRNVEIERNRAWDGIYHFSMNHHSSGIAVDLKKTIHTNLCSLASPW